MTREEIDKKALQYAEFLHNKFNVPFDKDSDLAKVEVELFRRGYREGTFDALPDNLIRLDYSRNS